VRSPMIYRQTADGCSPKIRQGSSAQVLITKRINWTRSQYFLAMGLKLFKLLSILHMAWLARLVFVV
jgi:hypothetical protein